MNYPLIKNLSSLRSKKFNYIGLDQMKESGKRIDYYWRYGYFEDIPEVTDEIYNSVTGSVFYNCTFIGDYKYGKLLATATMFNNTCVAMYDDINEVLEGKISTVEIHPYSALVKWTVIGRNQGEFLDFKDHI